MSQALKFVLSMIAPTKRRGVIAAKTNWNQMTVDVGMLRASSRGADHRLRALGQTVGDGAQRPDDAVLADGDARRIPEAEVVSEQDPDHEHRRKAVEAHQRGVYRELLPRQSAVVEGQTRDALQPHERGRCHHPRVASSVQPAWDGGGGEAVQISRRRVRRLRERGMRAHQVHQDRQRHRGNGVLAREELR